MPRRDDTTFAPSRTRQGLYDFDAPEYRCDVCLHGECPDADSSSSQECFDPEDCMCWCLEAGAWT